MWIVLIQESLGRSQRSTMNRLVVLADEVERGSGSVNLPLRRAILVPPPQDFRGLSMEISSEAKRRLGRDLIKLLGGGVSFQLFEWMKGTRLVPERYHAVIKRVLGWPAVNRTLMEIYRDIYEEGLRERVTGRPSVLTL